MEGNSIKEAKIPELLSPAGDWPSLKAAVESGADSVYFGVKALNMRANADNFDVSELNKITEYLRSKNKRGYLSINSIILDHEIQKAEKILKAAKASAIDAVILWDMAAFSLAKEMGIPIHLSTQASVSNIKALEEFHKLGAKRVILARECTLSDLRRITKGVREKGLDCEIETFIHGAMCVSISGRCFLSLYSHGKSANKGECVQPCRREYTVTDKEGEMEFLLGENYVLSPKDLCAVDFIDDLIGLGIDSFKIEGRMRSAEYAKVVTSVYREAIDSHFQRELDEKKKTALKERLASVYNRGFSSGFYFGPPQGANSLKLGHTHQKIFLGEVTRFFKKIKVAEIKLKTGGLSVGDELLFIGKGTPAESLVVKEMQIKKRFIDRAQKGEAIGLKVPFNLSPRDKVFLWVKR
ncbi:MAG: U32 family peptidase [Candidatus Omnitrophica bacterium]|nr:U32 family peptidase [Candidatus Omnitrophota bacterium]